VNVKDALARARSAAKQLRVLPLSARNDALEAIAVALEDAKARVLTANREDLAAATQLSPAMLDRLKLDEARYASILTSVREVKAQQDPLGAARELGRGRAGFRVQKRRIPLGVIAIVYEARPNVTAECAALTIKSGNAVVLRGGKEALRSNREIAEAVRAGIHAAGLLEDAVVFIDDTDRSAVIELLGSSGAVDLLIPRGGAALMSLVDEHARVPVIRHGEGICHVYVDEAADPKMAIDIAFNAKVHRPGVCNAMETLLVHERRLTDVLVPLGARLAQAGVELRADPAALQALTGAGITAQAARPEDFDTEFLGLTLAIATMQTLESALEHVEGHGTHHTAAIVTDDQKAADRFLDQVDASCVLWNASTRFNDGGELGLGAEMGISTSKMHAYGPMSALELTTEKLVVLGRGEIRT
jgi:glutamate-5-semialdehyde dehydrogenase